MKKRIPIERVLSIVTALLAGITCLPAAHAAETSPTSSIASSPSTATTEFRPSKVLVARLNDESINPVTSRFVIDTISRAESENAMVVLELDTPGGLLQSTREIVKRIIGSTVPVATYVYPSGSRAASAGMFITLSSHVAAMAPSTNIGAAHVVDITGSWPTSPQGREATGTLDILGQNPLMPGGGPAMPSPKDVMSEKVMNDTVAWARGIAELRGRNAEWAKAAIQRSASVTAQEAVQLGVVDFVAVDLADLLTKADGRTLRLATRDVVLRSAGISSEVVELSGRQRILAVLANPNIALLLLMIGFAGLMYEITHPGILVPGVVGVVALLLAALALNMLPTNYAAILLIIAGIGLIIAEIKFTSYGLLTLGGAVCLFFGALALFDQPAPFIGVSLTAVTAIVGSTVALMVLLVFLVIRAQSRRPAMGEESFVGATAEVVRALEPKGKVFYDGTYWNAVSPVFVAKGEKVRIVGAQRLTLMVEPDKREG
jgi:membrane-bound serine protease (ClpP class)